MGGRHIDLNVSMVMQGPDTWSLTGDIDGYRIRGLSDSPEWFSAEIYAADARMTGVLGTCAIHWSRENNSFQGVERLEEIIEALDVAGDNDALTLAVNS